MTTIPKNEAAWSRMMLADDALQRAVDSVDHDDPAYCVGQINRTIAKLQEARAELVSRKPKSMEVSDGNALHQQEEAGIRDPHDWQ